MEKKYLIGDKELMREWNYDKNGTLNPSTITYGIGKQLEWKCSKKNR